MSYGKGKRCNIPPTIGSHSLAARTSASVFSRSRASAAGSGTGELFFSIPEYRIYCEYNPQTYEKECSVQHLGFFLLAHAYKLIDQAGATLTALATIVLAIFTWRLWKSTHRLWTASNTQLKDAREAFIATHRPKLFIRRMKLVDPVQDVPLRIQFVVVNGGNTPATVAETGATIFLCIETGGELPHECRPRIAPLQIPPGESRPVVTTEADDLHYDSAWDLNNPAGWSEKERSTWKLTFQGFITYTDDNGVRRTTAFNRVYNPSLQRLDPIGDPDYEYTD